MINAVSDNPGRHRYELDVDGQVVFADYRREGAVLTILHVEAPPALRGTGAAGRFMQGMMEKVRKEGLKVMPVCSYAVAWLGRHKEYQDLIADSKTD